MTSRKLMGKLLRGYSNRDLRRLLYYFRQPLENADTRTELENKTLNLEEAYKITPKERMEALKAEARSGGGVPRCPEGRVSIAIETDLEEIVTHTPAKPTPARPTRAGPALTKPFPAPNQSSKPVAETAPPKTSGKRTRDGRVSSIAGTRNESTKTTGNEAPEEALTGTGIASKPTAATSKDASKPKAGTRKKPARAGPKVTSNKSPNAVTSQASPKTATPKTPKQNLSGNVNAHKTMTGSKKTPHQPPSRHPTVKGVKPGTDRAGGPNGSISKVFEQPRTAIEGLMSEDRDAVHELAMDHNLFGPSPRLDVDPAFVQLSRPRPQTTDEKNDQGLESIACLEEYEAELFDKQGEAQPALKDVLVEYRQYDHIGGWFCFPKDKSNENETASVLYCHGRGPAWGAWAPSQDLAPAGDIGKHIEGQSDSIDCLIMAGHFVDAGRTIADKGPYTRDDWAKRLSPIQKEYLECVNADWNDFTRLGSVRKKKQLYDAVLLGLSRSTKKKLTVGNFLMVDKIWSSFLKDAFFQFSFSFSIEAWCSGCGIPKISPPKLCSVIELLNYTSHTASQTFSMGSLLEEYFSTRSPLSTKEVAPWTCCGGKAMHTRRRIVHGSLPPRLAVSAVARAREEPAPIFNHTDSEITFSYKQKDYGERLATYRWIGGIYLFGQRYRVYWNDESRENNYKNRLKVYDSMMPDYTCYGYVLGGAVSPPDAGLERVPEPWCKSPHLLFYERVDSDMRAGRLREVEGAIWRLINASERDTGAPREIDSKIDDEDILKLIASLQKERRDCGKLVNKELEELRALEEPPIPPAQAYRARVFETHLRDRAPEDKADIVLARTNPAAPKPQLRFPPLYKPSIWDKGPDGFYLGRKHITGLVPVMPYKKRKYGDFNIKEFLPKKELRRNANAALTREEEHDSY